MSNLYTATERVILCDYFRQERPDALKDLDIYGEQNGIYVHHARYSDSFELPNAVARIALKRVQNNLPVWACSDQAGDITVTRVYEDHPGQEIELLPQYLFMINWADSGPGFSWPEAYHLVWFPEFDRYVVTASQDSPDCYGFEDIAIGFAPFDHDRKELSRKIICNWWEESRSNDQEPWECLFGSGFITVDEAYSWREDVWNSVVLDDDEEGAL